MDLPPSTDSCTLAFGGSDARFTSFAVSAFKNQLELFIQNDIKKILGGFRAFHTEASGL